MSPGEAAKALQEEIRVKKELVQNQMNARLPRGANALRNAELTVLSGNSSPSPPGSPPGRRSGFLRTAWTMYHLAGQSGKFGIISGAHYAGYLEHGTSKMAARPFAQRIQQAALPEIISIFSEIGG